MGRFFTKEKDKKRYFSEEEMRNQPAFLHDLSEFTVSYGVYGRHL